MTNAATVTSDVSDTADVAPVPIDPNAIVELDVFNLANAGRAPVTAWGKVQFDDDGKGKVKLPLKDVSKMHELKWLSAEDQEKYLGISKEAEKIASQGDVSDLQKQLDATKAANVRLATRNAELEAKVDEILAKYQEESKAYQAKVGSDMKAMSDALDKANAQLAAMQPMQSQPMQEPAKAEKKAEKKDK